MTQTNKQAALALMNDAKASAAELAGAEMIYLDLATMAQSEQDRAYVMFWRMLKSK